jgi:hypothetical protein
MRLTVAIDDVNPQRGYRILGEKTETWLRNLNEEFGIRFTLFVPSNYHKNNPLSENKDWVKELNSIEWLELAAHGHYHMTSDAQRFGECEFAEIDSHTAKERILMLEDEWASCEVMPIGWRNPGWLINPSNVPVIESSFEYVAIHYEHNRGLKWGCKTFFGHDGIQMTNISLHNEDMIMFQSHIAGSHNHNVWSQDNYDQLHLSLTHLFESNEITPKLLKECLT